tara:strand:- start:79 stop:387 length:309 start_codon:yes stop_codon:yes gene_type:complete
MNTFQSAVESQFKFALRNGSGTFSINGKTIKALLVDPPVTEGSQRRGRQRSIRKAVVGVLKSELPSLPSPGQPAKLNGWSCVVSEDGIEEEAFAYRIPLRSP